MQKPRHEPYGRNSVNVHCCNSRSEKQTFSHLNLTEAIDPPQQSVLSSKQAGRIDLP